MPKPAVLAACRQVLLDEEQTPSLIGVFAAIDVLPPAGVEIQHNAINPNPWVLCSMWLADEGDMNKRFTHKVKMTLPDGIEFGQASEEFTMVSRVHTITVRVPMLPVGVQGNLTVDAWVESDTKKVAENKYRISISHRMQ